MNKKQIKEKIKASILKAQNWYKEFQQQNVPNFTPKTLIMDVSNMALDSDYCGMLFYNHKDNFLSYLLPNLGEEFGCSKPGVSLDEQINDFSTAIYKLQENVLKNFPELKISFYCDKK